MNGQGLDRASNWIHWIARALGTLFSVFWIVILFLPLILGEGAGETHSQEEIREGIALNSIVVVTAVGVAIAWWREGIGGIVTTICGVVLSVFAYISADRNEAMAMLVSGIPFLVIGLLFIASWQLSKQNKEA